MLTKTVPTSASGAAGYSVHYGYDLRNAQTFARFGSASGLGLTNAYDAFGRPASTINSTGGTSRTLTYQYDVGSRRARLTFPDGNFLTYDYSPAGELTHIRENGAGAVATFAYDGAARLASRTGVSGASAASYGYDPISRLASLSHDLAGTGADQALGFAYNPASQVVTRTSANDAYASTSAYNVSRNYSVNGLNQYTAAGPATFAYDANGNLTSDGSTAYVYDAENRLVSASGATSATLSYDPLGRLFQVQGGGNTTQFLYDGDELVLEYDGAGAWLRRYAHGTGTDDPIVWYEGGGLSNRRSLYTNHQGSIVAVADGSGAALAINAYDPWGIPNAGNQGRFGYTGQIWLPEIGMWHYKARIYSPTLGRFLQTDPVGYEDQINLYAYVGNDPVNITDPTGMCGEIDSNDPGRCKINPDPAGDGSVRITFQNDDPNGASPDRYIDANTANSFEAAVVRSGVSHVNVNSTTGGGHSPTSRHYSGQAIDVNRVNGERVDRQGASPAVSSLQREFSRAANVRENYGPSRNQKTESNGSVREVPSVAAQHRNHLHFSTQSIQARTQNGTFPVVILPNGRAVVKVPEYP